MRLLRQNRVHRTKAIEPPAGPRTAVCTRATAESVGRGRLQKHLVEGVQLAEHTVLRLVFRKALDYRVYDLKAAAGERFTE